MNSKPSVTPLLPDGANLCATVAAFQRVQQQQLTELCYNGDKLLSTLTLHDAMYVQVTG